MADKKYADISIIGGINIDIEGCPYEELKYQDSNPGKINIAFGGVGRNITENIARMGGSVAMVSVAGDDFAGKGAKAQLEQLGVDTKDVHLLPGQTSAMYLSILNKNNDMEVAMCNMDILENLTPDFMDSKLERLKQSKMVALDCNLREEILEYLTDKLAGVPMFLDPVSSPKAERIKNLIGRFHTIKPNRQEAEVISGLTIDTDEDLRQAGNWFLDRGVKRVYISLSEKGVYYKDKDSEGFIKPNIDKIVSATGAGDAFSAAILLGSVRRMSTADIARLGMAAASIAMEARTAVNENITMDKIVRRMTNV